MMQKHIQEFKKSFATVLAGATLTVAIYLFFMRTGHMHTFYLLGIGWIFFACGAEYTTYKWLIPMMDEMIEHLGQPKPKEIEGLPQTFGEWFAQRGWDFISVLVFDAVLLLFMGQVLTRVFGIPW